MLSQAFLTFGVLLACFAPAPFPREEFGGSLGIEFVQGNGLQVKGVFVSSPALEAGLAPYDTVVAMDGQRITTQAELAKQLRRKKPGAHVRLVYRREGLETTVRLKLAPPVPVYLGVGFGDDLMIVDITPNSPAAAAGLRANDLILALDKTKLTTLAELMVEFKKKRSGDLVDMTIRRNNAEITVRVKLGKRPGY